MSQTRIFKRKDIHTDAMGFAFPLVDLVLFCFRHSASINAHINTAITSPTDDKNWAWGILKILPQMESRIFGLKLLYQRRRPSLLQELLPGIQIINMNTTLAL